LTPAAGPRDDVSSKGVPVISSELPPTPSAEPGPSEQQLAYETAKQRAQNLQGLYIHLIVYAVVNAGLFAINALTRGDGGNWWFYWVSLIWGIGLLIHLATFLRVFSPDWAERKAQEEMRRSGRP
jgi:2TM domain